jgi:hypothetical protein
MKSYLNEKVEAPVYKTEINRRDEPPLWPRDTPLSAKVGTKIRWPTADTQSA